MKTNIHRIVGTTLLGFLSSLCVAQSQDAAELAKKLANPIASLVSLPLQNNLDHGIGPYNGSRYTLNVQPVVPFSLNKNLNLITRVVLPIVSQFDITGEGTKQSGLADAVVSGFFSPTNSKNGVTWGAGPVMLLPIGTHDFLSANQFGMGPTAVALKQSNGWTYGALVNQIWGFGGDQNKKLSQLFFQPFLTYNWKSGAGVTAQLEWTENWQTGKSNIWFDPTISGLTSLGKQKVSLAVGPRFNIAAPDAQKSKFGLRAAVSFLFPK
jgi:hypothetical protein